MENLFVYGTLRDAAVQQRIIGRVVRGSADWLEGYRLESISTDGAVYPIAVQAGQGEIAGEVLSLTQDELAQCDVYEGDDYRRVQVALASGQTAWVYCR